ncbi:MAG: hypothetical protein LBV80_03115 [Deltaproteobacteria bacterium]|jgi:hypothetical protein|nr:hypothetical protein [Deltaproteobacteria bacterium]
MDHAEARRDLPAEQTLPCSQMGNSSDCKEEKLPEDQDGLEKRLAELADELVACQTRIRELSAAENPATGVFFAAEIHAARQNKLVLEFKKQLCRARLNRLNIA